MARSGVAVSPAASSAGADDHVARPDQVIAAEFVVAFVLAPGDAQAGDHRAGIELVFVRQQQVDAAGEEKGVARRTAYPWFMSTMAALACAMPLFDEAALRLLRKGSHSDWDRVAPAAWALWPKAKRESELVPRDRSISPSSRRCRPWRSRTPSPSGSCALSRSSRH